LTIFPPLGIFSIAIQTVKCHLHSSTLTTE
jgi:hypothetical protein